jgi:acetolactate synthase I/II/III large subunit
VRIRLATAIAKALEAGGTEYCFGYNGHGNWALLDAFVHETGIQTVAARSEDQAVHMADCYWRTRRRPPMAVVTTSVGPGSTNITPAVAAAFFDSSALLVLAGGGATQWYDRGGIEEFYRYGPEEWPTTLKALTKKSYSVNRPDTALEMVLRGYKTAVSGRPGPVVVQLPFDIQHTEIDIERIPDLATWTTVSPPAADPDAITAAADLITTAQRPLLTVSSGIHNARAWAELARLAEEFSIPVATAVPGKGTLPEDHRLSLGCLGRAGTDQANQAARECDVLIAVGTRFGDIDTGGWTLYDIPGSTKLIHIDIDDGELGRVYQPEVAIVSDARSALRALQQELATRPQPERAEWLARVAALREEWGAKVAPLRASDASPMEYARVFSDVSDVLSSDVPDATVLFDTGHSLSFGPPFLQARSRHYIHSGAFHRMGWTVPGAVGARLARPDQPVLVMVGDGSFVMSGAAVLTAVELSLPIVYVVLNNATLQIEREQMVKFYGRHSLTDYARLDTGAPHNPDFAAWAAAMGAHGMKVSQPSELKPAVRKALASGGPTVIDVDIDPLSAGYRAIHYPYPSDFGQRGIPRPPW